MRSLIAIALGLSAGVVSAAPAPWELVEKVGDIEVYRRDNPNSDTKSLKGTGVIPVPVSKVVQVLLDCRHAPDWVDSLAESRVVRQHGPSRYVEYNRVSMPFIVNDREFVTDVRMEVDAEARRVTIRSAPIEDATIRHRNKYVRGTLSALYLLEATPEGHTRVSIEVDSDPKGWLPGWLVDFFQKDWPRLTIEGIRSQTQKPLAPPPEFQALLGTIPF
jgi:hypothetical protein